MTVEKAVREALAKGLNNGDFAQQLQSNRQFTERMEQAGVVPRKQEYSIPLMERIVAFQGN